jgi:hypothetical protein
MAANDYFNGYPSKPHPPQSTTHAAPSYSQDLYTSSALYGNPAIPHAGSSYSVAPSYHTQPSSIKPNDNVEQIPLKQTSKIQTNPNQWQDQDTHYPPSPDDQTPTTLLEPKRRRRSKKKKGFFAAPIPWVVYTVSLVQITVFVVEIIRNGQSELYFLFQNANKS